MSPVQIVRTSSPDLSLLSTGAVTPDPPPEQIACQYPKPILLDTVRAAPEPATSTSLTSPAQGYANTPYQWSPHTVDIQMLRAGNLVIAVIPGELTTMSGRRMRCVPLPPLYARRADSRRPATRSAHSSSPRASRARTRTSRSRAPRTRTRTTSRRRRSTPCSATRARRRSSESVRCAFTFLLCGGGADARAGTLDAYIDKYTSLVPYLGASASGTPASDPAPEDQTGKAISLQVRLRADTSLLRVLTSRLDGRRPR